MCRNRGLLPYQPCKTLYCSRSVDPEGTPNKAPLGHIFTMQCTLPWLINGQRDFIEFLRPSAQLMVALNRFMHTHIFVLCCLHPMVLMVVSFTLLPSADHAPCPCWLQWPACQTGHADLDEFKSGTIIK